MQLLNIPGSRVIIFRLITMAVFVQKCEKSSEIQRRSFYFLWVKAKFFFSDGLLIVSFTSFYLGNTANIHLPTPIPVSTLKST